MPWKEVSMLEERYKFVIAYKSGDWSMTELCNEFGISRTTGYKFLKRYDQFGLDGLRDLSHAVHYQPQKTSEQTTQLIIEMREKYPTWGPKKLRKRLQGRYPDKNDWPAVSTIGEILKREGMIKPRKKRRKNPVKIYPLSHVSNPNEVWCADFKGHFTVGNGKRCDPLTITDAHSRFLLECLGVSKTNTEHVQKAFTGVFREFGVPDAIRTDNGSPFASRGLAGLSRLSVWWLKLGIRLERIKPGKPQENGRHERMHRTLKQETALPARSSLEAQQKAFNEFMEVYNYERPHEALEMKCPAAVYNRSAKEFPEKIPDMEYITSIEPYRVSDEGNIRYGVHRVFLSSSLRNEVIGIEDINDRQKRIYFGNAILGILDSFSGKVLHYQNPMEILE